MARRINLPEYNRTILNHNSSEETVFALGDQGKLEELTFEPDLER